MRLIASFLLLAGCGAPDDAKHPAANEAGGAAPAAAPRVPNAAEIADMDSAAAALRNYYAHIARRDYRAAWALRERRPGLDFEAFARSFALYADYHADVGQPSFPAAADGFVWIDAPVQIWGRQHDGERFGSVGRVMLKRPAGSRVWKVAP
ncbi:MAG TPA: hypothetical protein VF702_13705 [Allosphingosinicella sp.]|jgi:hypothetical protein